jgi:hypothetical protein
MKRPEKITLGEMRAAGVRGLLIYCSDYKCSHSTAIGGGPMTFRCPILKRDLFAALAAPTAPMSGRISIGTRSSPGRPHSG